MRAPRQRHGSFGAHSESFRPAPILRDCDAASLLSESYDVSAQPSGTDPCDDEVGEEAPDLVGAAKSRAQ